MIVQRYLGGFYQLYFEEVNIRFLVHRSLIGDETRNMILDYMANGTLPELVNAVMEDQVICFLPDSVQVGSDSSPSMDGGSSYLWFVL